MIYAGVLYDTMYLPVSPISTSCHKYTGHINDCLYEKYKTNIVLHFSSKVPGSLTKNVTPFFFFFFSFFFHSFYTFLSVTADTIKLELIFKIRPNATKVAKRSVHLRNKFRFSEVHGSMNTTDHMQSKWCQKGVTLSLHGTRCFHTFVNLRKMKFISYIYTLFLHRFCSLFVEFLFKSCKHSGKETL